MNNDLIKLSTAIIHLRKASNLVEAFNEDLSLCILELANAICTDYKISHSNIDEIEKLSNKIIENNEQ